MKTASFFGQSADEQLMRFLVDKEPSTYFVKAYKGKCSSDERKIIIRYEEKKVKVF